MLRLLPTMAMFVCAHSSLAGEARVSFLNDPAALEDTITVLKEAGCSKTDLLCFRRAVTTYYKTPFSVDVSAFPPPKDGFYSFPSTAVFVSALHGKLFETTHSSQITCFDTAILLAGPQMNVRQELRPQGGPLLVAVAGFHGFHCTAAASLADAYSLVYPAVYLESLERTAGLSLSAKHKAIDVALCSFHVLPLNVPPDHLQSELMKVLRADWARTGIVFPQHVSLVLLHEAATDAHEAVTDHAGILVPYKDKFMYLEKSGGQGPFLRMDVAGVADVATYYQSILDRQTPCHFMTVNDREIRELKLSQTQDAE
jgi:hypothetical protein